MLTRVCGADIALTRWQRYKHSSDSSYTSMRVTLPPTTLTSKTIAVALRTSSDWWTRWISDWASSKIPRIAIPTSLLTSIWQGGYLTITNQPLCLRIRELLLISAVHRSRRHSRLQAVVLLIDHFPPSHSHVQGNWITISYIEHKPYF